jgi:hypothetical protein
VEPQWARRGRSSPSLLDPAARSSATTRHFRTFREEIGEVRRSRRQLGNGHSRAPRRKR